MVKMALEDGVVAHLVPNKLFRHSILFQMKIGNWQISFAGLVWWGEGLQLLVRRFRHEHRPFHPAGVEGHSQGIWLKKKYILTSLWTQLDSWVWVFQTKPNSTKPNQTHQYQTELNHTKPNQTWQFPTKFDQPNWLGMHSRTISSFCWSLAILSTLDILENWDSINHICGSRDSRAKLSYPKITIELEMVYKWKVKIWNLFWY